MTRLYTHTFEKEGQNNSTGRPPSYFKLHNPKVTESAHVLCVPLQGKYPRPYSEAFTIDWGQIWRNLSPSLLVKLPILSYDIRKNKRRKDTTVIELWKKIESKQFSSLYLLYGTEPYIINETKEKLVANVLTNDEEMDFNLSVYDLEETPIEVALEDAETFPFFGERKLIFLHNPYFLTSEKPKEKVEHNLVQLEQYIATPASYSILVFMGNYEKLDERKKITKLLKKQAAVLEGKKLNERELESWIIHQAKNEQVEIEPEAVEKLITLVGTDMMRLYSELQKIFLYVKDERKIDSQIVEKLASRSLEQNIFDLIDKVVHRKMEEAFRIYYDLRKQNEEPIKILSLLASQFRLIYQVKELYKRSYGQAQIASMLKVHPYRVKLALAQSKYFTEIELVQIIDLLTQTDEKLKTGGAGREVSLELFLLQLSSLK